MWFTRISIANPVLATMLMAALMVLGLFSYQRLKVDQFPDIEFPIVVVTVEYPGASAEVVETEVTRKVEESVNAIAGINQLSSRSYAGTSVVIVQFDLSMDSSRAWGLFAGLDAALAITLLYHLACRTGERRNFRYYKP